MEPTGDEPTHKYTIEHALTIGADWTGIVSPAYLDKVNSIPDVPNCNIYMIARRPRITVDLSRSFCANDELTLAFTSQPSADELVTAEITGPTVFDMNVRLEKPQVPTHIKFVDDNDKLVLEMPSASFLAAYMQGASEGFTFRQENPSFDEDLLDLEILYVGQSLDAGGATERRLLHHPTLQKILAEESLNRPHSEIWVILMLCGTYNNVAAVGPWQAAASQQVSLQHFKTVHETALSGAELTALAEAALIRYFQPEYNKTFLYNFPKPLHTTYRSIYGLDYNSVGIDFETFTTLGMRLRSPAVDPTFLHAGLFHMHDRKSRGRLFDFIESEDKPSRIYFSRSDQSETD